MMKFLCRLFGHRAPHRINFDYDRQLVVGHCRWCQAEMTRRIRGDWIKPTGSSR